MTERNPHRESIRFGAFEVNPAAFELRKSGVRIRLQHKPFRLLTMLLERPGEVVTREELIEALWPDEHYGEFEISLNQAVKRVRAALGDSASHPRWVETIPKVGYRFVSPIDEPSRSSPRPVPAARPPAERRPRTAWRVAALVGLLVVAVIVILERRPPPQASSRLPAQFVETLLTSYRGREIQPSFSPRGDMIAYARRSPGRDTYDVFIEITGSGRAAPITRDPGNDWAPVFAPDGRSIAFTRQQPSSDRADLIVVPVPSGPERKVLTFRHDGWPPAQVSWSPDGSRLAFSAGSDAAGPYRIGLVELASSEVEWLTAPEQGVVGDRSPAFSPDGAHLAFVRAEGQSSGLNIWLLPLSQDYQRAGPARQLTRFDRLATSPAWSPGGRELLFLGEARPGYEGIWSIAPDGRGEPRLIWRSPGVFVLGAAPDAAIATTRTGSGDVRVAFSWHPPDDEDIYRVDLDGPKRGVPIPVISTSARDTWASLSPDGRRIAFLSGRPGRDVFVADADGRNVRRLTYLESRIAGSVSWAPNNRDIALHSRPQGASDIYVVNADSGKLRRVTRHPSDDAMAAWSRDSAWIYFRSNRTGPYTVWKTPAQGGDERLVLDATHQVVEEAWSADRLYLSSAPGGRDFFELRLDRESAEPQPILEDSAGGIHAFRVAPSGLYFVRREGELLPRVAAPGVLCHFEAATRQVRELFPVEGYLSSVSSDESYVLMVHGKTTEADIKMLEPRS